MCWQKSNLIEEVENFIPIPNLLTGIFDLLLLTNTDCYVNEDRLQKPLAKARATFNVQVVLYKEETVEVVGSRKGFTDLSSKAVVAEFEKSRVLGSYSLNERLELGAHL